MPNNQPAKRSLSPVRRPLLRTRSGDTRGVARSISFNAKSLTRTLSFNRKNVRPSNNPGEDEVNLFMSDMVTKEYCMEKLTEVKQHTAVVKMEIEDLLVSRHSSLVPIIKQLVVGGSRDWEWIRFTDTADVDDFKVWQGKKHNICQGFEATVEDKSKYEDIMSFECTIRVCKGTSHLEAKKILQAIQGDHSVYKLSFEGSLYHFDDALKPVMMHKFVDGESGDLLDEVVLNIKCGWNAELSQASKRVLEECIQALNKSDSKQEQEEARQAPLRRARTSASPVRRPQIPRRSPVRRCISVDDDDDEVSGGVKRTVSMPTSRRQTTLSPTRRQSRGTDAPRRPRRATSPLKQREEQEEPRPRGRSSERTSVTSTTSTASSLSSTEDDQSVGSAPVTPARRRTPPRGGSFHSTGDERSVASAPQRRLPRRVRSFHSTSVARDLPEAMEEDSAPCMPVRKSLSSSPVRRASPRRTKSFHAASSETPDFNWADFTNTKKAECEDDPDYDWKSGVYIVPLASKAAKLTIHNIDSE